MGEDADLRVLELLPIGVFDADFVITPQFGELGNGLEQEVRDGPGTAPRTAAGPGRDDARRRYTAVRASPAYAATPTRRLSSRTSCRIPEGGLFCKSSSISRAKPLYLIVSGAVRSAFDSNANAAVDSPRCACARATSMKWRLRRGTETM